MKQFYLIGKSTGTSLSPAIHNWIFNTFNINAKYKKKDIDSSNFEMEISNMLVNIKSSLINGMNITNPYKIAIISSGIQLSKDAQRINAVNCVYKQNNLLIGNNTDWIGFIKSIDDSKINLNNYNIKIIGAGGAARAIIYGLQKLNIKNFKIYNRNQTNFIINKTEYITSDLEKLNSTLLEDTFLINCIDTNIIDNILTDKQINAMRVFYDLNYHKTQFHNTLIEKDIKVISGLDMLIYQAIKSIEIWLEEEFINKINIEEIKAYLEKKSLC